MFRKALLAAAAFGAMFATAAHAAPPLTSFPIATAPAVFPVVADNKSCKVNQALAWCIEHVGIPQDDSWTRERVNQVDAAVREHFSYRTKFAEVWLSRLDRVQSGKIWTGDCTALTTTTLDALLHQGFPENRMYRLIVNTDQEAGAVQHMVGLVEINGEYFVVGDTMADGGIYPLKQARFKAVYVNRVSDGPAWRKASDKAS